jgi:preprotein translocase subunit SecD
VIAVFMVGRYKGFGAIATAALAVNVVLIIAALSMLQATLTLPGIAGIVLTMGMAVDANVLIYERIREELRNGNSPQAAIHAGFDRAFDTILDSNLTTLIAAIMLFGFGTGPIKGFAVTLSIGILTSMFTAVTGSRALVNLIYGGRKLQKLTV